MSQANSSVLRDATSDIQSNYMMTMQTDKMFKPPSLNNERDRDSESTYSNFKAKHANLFSVSSSNQ